MGGNQRAGVKINSKQCDFEVTEEKKKNHEHFLHVTPDIASVIVRLCLIVVFF